MVSEHEKRMPSLSSYKYFIRPRANQLYGNSKTNPKTKHQTNVQKLLKIFALKGPMTTWEIAKVKFPDDDLMVRSKEKEFRRLLLGRVDRGKRNEGILDLKLIVVDSISQKRNPGKKYRLSLYGVLFCLDSMNLSNKEIDTMAENYKFLLPKVFGNWEFLKSKIDHNVYNIVLLGKGMLFDNPNTIKILNPEFYDLISYFNIKASISESLTEEKIGELISYWFFTSLLYFPNILQPQKNKKEGKNYLISILKKNKELNSWVSNYVEEARNYYKHRYHTLRNMKLN